MQYLDSEEPVNVFFSLTQAIYLGRSIHLYFSVLMTYAGIWPKEKYITVVVQNQKRVKE